MSTPVATLAAELRVSLSRASRRLKAERGDADLPDPHPLGVSTPPAWSAARWRALISGSSGRGNGMRSMITSWQVSPGTSSPCHSPSVPNRIRMSPR